MGRDEHDAEAIALSVARVNSLAQEKWGDGYGLSAPLKVHIQRLLRTVAQDAPPYDVVLFGENGYGPDALPWDGSFRPIDECEERWERILSVTNKDWINLVCLGVTDSKLFVAAEYVADGASYRPWPNHVISVNFAGSTSGDPIAIIATW